MTNHNSYENYHISIARELEASKNRVRYFIGSNHWPEDGRYKEILLMNYLRKILPSNVSVGTGFIKSKEKVSTQIDIIVYRNDLPTLFKEGDFVIVAPESVYGIIEVKTRITSSNFRKTIDDSQKNGLILSEIDREVFYGVFGYDATGNLDNLNFDRNYKTLLQNSRPNINHISWGSNYFSKYWFKDGLEKPVYSLYKIKELSFGYFISNLLYNIYSETNTLNFLSEDMRSFLFPIDKGKEQFKIADWEVTDDVSIS